MIRLVFQILLLLNRGIVARNTVHAEHDQVQKLASQLVIDVNRFFSESGRSQLAFSFWHGALLFSGQSISLSPSEFSELILFSKRLHCDGFFLQKNILPKDFENFFDVGVLRGLPSKNVEQSQALFARYGIKTIRPFVGSAQRGGGIEETARRNLRGSSLTNAKGEAERLNNILGVLNTAHKCGAESKNIELVDIRGAGEMLLRLVRRDYFSVIQSLRYSDFDNYKIAHSIRMAVLALFAGIQMNWPEKELVSLASAALLHDIGTSQIAGNILLKKSGFTREEWSIIQRHPHLGGHILIENPGVSLLELAVCWGHHTRHDGGGYPEKPPWYVRSAATSLLQICDVFEALTAARPHRPSLEPQAAYQTMIGDRGAFHPGLLASFIGLLGMYPPGTGVQLSDGREGSVVRNNAILDRPILWITHHSGQPLGVDDEYELDLSNANLGWLAIVAAKSAA